ncbi:MAG: 3-isopropylmalate dehydratase small subunit, partial [Planktomarina sp.]
MDKFETMTAIAAPMPLINIDTDMIIPKQFLKTIKRSGLGVSAFHEMRYDMDGNENPDFVLNQDAYRDANILIAGDNFGCGSSREHAPWALLDFGIRCVVSTSFADIFFNNCFKNGLLPIVLDKAIINGLFQEVEANEGYQLEVDLEQQTINKPDGSTIPFSVDEFRKNCLLNGLDDIGLTLEEADKIRSFEQSWR